MKENLNYKRISLVLLILVILAIIPHFCNNTDRLQGQYDILKKQLSEQKQIVNKLEQERIKEKDSLMFQISQREVSNSFLTAENNNLKDRIKTLNNRINKKIKGLENLVTYFNDRYKVNNNVVVENKVGLTEETASDVTWELEDYDKVVEVSTLQESVIKNQDTIISNLNKDKVDLSLVISSAENEITERKKLQEMAEDNIEVLEKQVKKQKKKNFWNKVLIGVGTVGGFLLGTQISK
jgi:peptidoglycan hydrolase CwlO-like protein